MDNRKNGLPIVSLILSIIAFLLAGSATSNDSDMMGISVILVITSCICSLISILGKNYKKICATISLVFCFLSFLFFMDWSNTNAEYAKQEAENNAKTYVITFDTDGGKEIPPMTVHPNTYLTSVVPYKEGYDFTTWTLNGAVFNFSGYVNDRITSNVTLKANYTKKQTTSSTTPSASSSSSSNYSNKSSNSNSNSSTTSKSSTTIQGYQQIYNEYSQKLIQAGPTSSINEMAQICNEGVSKMARYMYSASGTDGQYSTYQSWVSKLYDVYTSNCR